MIVTSVRYDKLVNLGNYENHKVGATATVGEEDKAEDVLDALRAWVDAQAGAEVEVREASGELQAIRYQMGQARREVEALISLWRQAKAFLLRAGVDVARYDEPYWFAEFLPDEKQAEQAFVERVERADSDTAVVSDW